MVILNTAKIEATDNVFNNNSKVITIFLRKLDSNTRYVAVHNARSKADFNTSRHYRQIYSAQQGSLIDLHVFFK